MDEFAESTIRGTKHGQDRIWECVWWVRLEVGDNARSTENAETAVAVRVCDTRAGRYNVGGGACARGIAMRCNQWCSPVDQCGGRQRSEEADVMGCHLLSWDVSLLAILLVGLNNDLAALQHSQLAEE